MMLLEQCLQMLSLLTFGSCYRMGILQGHSIFNNPTEINREVQGLAIDLLIDYLKLSAASNTKVTSG